MTRQIHPQVSAAALSEHVSHGTAALYRGTSQSKPDPPPSLGHSPGPESQRAGCTARAVMPDQGMGSVCRLGQCFAPVNSGGSNLYKH